MGGLGVSLDGNTAAPGGDGLNVCCVTSLPRGRPAVLTTGQAEEAVGWAALTQRHQFQPRSPGGQGASILSRQLDSGIPIPVGERGHCPCTGTGGERRMRG